MRSEFRNVFSREKGEKYIIEYEILKVRTHYDPFGKNITRDLLHIWDVWITNVPSMEPNLE